MIKNSSFLCTGFFFKRFITSSLFDVLCYLNSFFICSLGISMNLREGKDKFELLRCLNITFKYVLLILYVQTFTFVDENSLHSIIKSAIYKNIFHSFHNQCKYFIYFHILCISSAVDTDNFLRNSLFVWSFICKF